MMREAETRGGPDGDNLSAIVVRWGPETLTDEPSTTITETLGLGEFADADRPDADADRPQGRASATCPTTRSSARSTRSRRRSGGTGADFGVSFPCRSAGLARRARPRGSGIPRLRRPLPECARSSSTPRPPGLDPKQGHRIIELAALEVVNRRATGRTVHFRLDPEREIDAGATEVHGMTWDDLKGKPKFRDVAAEFIEFARGAEWIIHNAPFDIGFLDAELRLRRAAGVRGDLREPDRHAGARARDVSRQAQQPRCAVRALRRRQCAPDGARRAARRAAAGRGVSRDDARAGNADDRHGAAARRDGGRRRRGGRRIPPGRGRRWRRSRRRPRSSRPTGNTWRRSTGNRGAAASGSRSRDGSERADAPTPSRGGRAGARPTARFCYAHAASPRSPSRCPSITCRRS